MRICFTDKYHILYTCNLISSALNIIFFLKFTCKYIWEVFKIWQITSLCKSEQLDFKNSDLLIYWEYARCEYTILELKFHIFWKIQKMWKKINFRSFFRTLKSKKSLFKKPRPRPKFPKKSQNFANRPVEAGQVAETTPNLFFGVWEVPAIKMRHIPASYDHFWKSYGPVKLGHFWSNFRKSHLGRFADMDHRRKKLAF